MTEFQITVDIMLPLLILLSLGWLLRRVGLMTEAVTQGLSKLIFTILLPVLLFSNIRTLDLSDLPSLGYGAFLMLSVVTVFALAQLIIPRLVKDRRKSAVMVQGMFRSNFTILGIPLMLSMFGPGCMGVLALGQLIVASQNSVMAVLALSPISGAKQSPLQYVKKILTNPLIVGCAAGALFLVLRIPLPSVVADVCSDLGSVTSPLSLLVLGASLRWQGVKENRVYLSWIIVLRQLLIPLAMVALAVLLGFRGMELAAIMILFGAPTAVSSFPMAQAMGGDGPLAASIVALTTIFSMGTLFLLIYLCKLFMLF